MTSRDHWFAISKDLKTTNYDLPFKDTERILYWVRKQYSPKDDLLWYDYQIFDGNLEPTQITVGNFTCLKAYAIVPKNKNDDYWFGFEIIDGIKIIRKNEVLNNGEAGIVDIMKWMEKLATFGSWFEYEGRHRRPQNN
jgi:hypothetical protein